MSLKKSVLVGLEGGSRFMIDSVEKDVEIQGKFALIEGEGEELLVRTSKLNFIYAVNKPEEEVIPVTIH